MSFFGSAHWGRSYFGNSYFGTGSTSPPPPPPSTGAGGYFGSSYFGPAYFGDAYFGTGGAVSPPPPPTPGTTPVPGGGSGGKLPGGKRRRIFLPQRWADEKRQDIAGTIKRAYVEAKAREAQPPESPAPAPQEAAVPWDALAGPPHLSATLLGLRAARMPPPDPQKAEITDDEARLIASMIDEM